MADNREHTKALDLDALRKLCDEATLGPWVNEPNTLAGRVWVQRSARQYLGGKVRDCEPLFSVRGEDEYAQRIKDAEFIAAARSAVPALIAEVDRLHQQITALAQELDDKSKYEARRWGRTESAEQAALHAGHGFAFHDAARRLRSLVAPLSSPDSQENQ